MLPPVRKKIEYEKVVEDEWLSGIIDEIEYDLEHKSTFKGQEKVGPAIKIKMILDGYKFPKSSGWLSFNYSDKSNLYKTFICGLVDNPKPYMTFDPDFLKGMKIKCMYGANPNNPEYQKIVRIKPVGDKVKADAEPPESAIPAEEVPF